MLHALVLALCVVAVAPSASASAHNVSPVITVPPSPPAEDSGFAISFTAT